MIQNLIFGIILLKILFLAYNFFILIHMFQQTASIYFFVVDFRFLEESLKANKTCLLKTPHSFYEPQLA